MAEVHDEHECPGVGLCPECSQKATTEAFYAAAGEPAERCPECGQEMPDQPVRMTEGAPRGS